MARLLIGIVVAYPVALALDVIAFLGEGWVDAVILTSTLASMGFVGTLLLTRWIRERRSSTPRWPLFRPR